MHPNILPPGEKWWWVAWWRLKAMYWSLLTPEFIMLWAWRQRRGADEIAEEVRQLAKELKLPHGSDWFSIHGHYLQMGGFVLSEEGKDVRELRFPEFKKLVAAKSIDMPSITEEEIEDKSKTDPLARIIASFQILWFVTQVIARGAAHLVITELELTTTALAVLNVTMYFLWWDKPSDVHAPTVIKLLPKRVDVEVQASDVVGELSLMLSPEYLYQISLQNQHMKS